MTNTPEDKLIELREQVRTARTLEKFARASVALLSQYDLRERYQEDKKHNDETHRGSGNRLSREYESARGELSLIRTRLLRTPEFAFPTDSTSRQFLSDLRQYLREFNEIYVDIIDSDMF